MMYMPQSVVTFASAGPGCFARGWNGESRYSAMEVNTETQYTLKARTASLNGDEVRAR